MTLIEFNSSGDAHYFCSRHSRNGCLRYVQPSSALGCRLMDSVTLGAGYSCGLSLWGYDEPVRGVPRASAARADGEGMGVGRGRYGGVGVCNEDHGKRLRKVIRRTGHSNGWVRLSTCTERPGPSWIRVNRIRILFYKLPELLPRCMLI